MAAAPQTQAQRDIVLATINAKYIHAAFGLRCLRANLGPWRDASTIAEFTSQTGPTEIAEQLLAFRPKVIGLGVYIWNAAASRTLVAILKAVAPEVVVVVGGPEVSHEVDQQDVTARADYVVTGEGEDAFRRLCAAVLSGDRPPRRVMAGGLPDVARLALPYDEYTDEDVAQRVLYVEASRGCPFRCEFCLSSLDKTARPFPLAPFLDAMQRLLDRGVRAFKFVDRTFNLDIATSRAILGFFLDRIRPELFVHFELIPDRLPTALREMIARFPPGTLQFEIGVQTFDPDVCKRISRRQNLARLEDTFRFLRDETHAHVHADLIVGLPGETVAQFAAGFDRLLALGPHEVQVGILKRLRGAPIARHTAEFGMVYAESAPYEVLSTGVIDFQTMQRMKRFAHLWEVVVNRGNFLATAPLIWRAEESAFDAFLRLSVWVVARDGRVHAMALNRLATYLSEYLVEIGRDEGEVRAALAADYERTGRKLPGRLRPDVSAPARRRANARQARHQAVVPRTDR